MRASSIPNSRALKPKESAQRKKGHHGCTRPKTRGECGDRPCPWVSCKHHLYLDVTAIGSLILNFPDIEPWELSETCALDVAEMDGLTLEEVGDLMNITRERVRQLEQMAMEVFRNGKPGPRKKEKVKMEKTLKASDLKVGATYQNEDGERRRIVGGNQVKSRWGTRFTFVEFVTEDDKLSRLAGSAFLAWAHCESAPAEEISGVHEDKDDVQAPAAVPKPQQGALASGMAGLLGFAAARVGGMPVLVAQFVASKTTAEGREPMTVGELVDVARKEGWGEELKLCGLQELAAALNEAKEIR